MVLEENKELNESLILEDKKYFEFKKNHLQEISRLSKRLIVSETEKFKLLNEIDIYSAANEQMNQKYNELSIQLQKRIDLQDHLNQMADLKK